MDQNLIVKVEELLVKFCNELTEENCNELFDYLIDNFMENDEQKLKSIQYVNIAGRANKNIMFNSGCWSKWTERIGRNAEIARITGGLSTNEAAKQIIERLCLNVRFITRQEEPKDSYGRQIQD